MESGEELLIRLTKNRENYDGRSTPKRESQAISKTDSGKHKFDDSAWNLLGIYWDPDSAIPKLFAFFLFFLRLRRWFREGVHWKIVVIYNLLRNLPGLDCLENVKKTLEFCGMYWAARQIMPRSIGGALKKKIKKDMKMHTSNSGDNFYHIYLLFKRSIFNFSDKICLCY